MNISEYLEKRAREIDRRDKNLAISAAAVAPLVSMGGHEASLRLVKHMDKRSKKVKGYKHLGKLYKDFKSLGGQFPTEKELSRDVPRRPHFGSYGNPRLPTYVYARGASDPAKAHELGHGTGLGSKFKYRQFMSKARNFGRNALEATRGVAMLAPAAAVVSTKGMSNKERARGAEIARNVIALSALPQAPELFEEGRASIRAARFAPKGKKLKYLKELLPAFGTYGFSLGGAALTGVVASELLRRHYLKKAKKKAIKNKVRALAKKSQT